jgi:ADP-dependent NAD(P)H-hydrate dehydratase
MSDSGQPPLPHLPRRDPEGHKGTYGRALLIGGSSGMPGSISLSGMAALRAGAGLVSLAVPTACQQAVAGFEPCYMTLGLPSDAGGRIAGDAQPLIAAELASVTAAACGPGLGRSTDLDDLVAWLYRETRVSLVLDADALNSLASHIHVASSPGGPRVLTPHPGEFARLAQMSRPPAASERNAAAAALAERTGAIMVLKGHRTVITDGRQTAVNTTGNAGMATGGMGDVLTGVITALLCQGLEPFAAARLGVHVHGLAGDLAAEEIGPVGITARDVLQRLPKALATVIEPAEEN